MPPIPGRENPTPKPAPKTVVKTVVPVKTKSAVCVACAGKGRNSNNGQCYPCLGTGRAGAMKELRKTINPNPEE